MPERNSEQRFNRADALIFIIVMLILGLGIILRFFVFESKTMIMLFLWSAFAFYGAAAIIRRRVHFGGRVGLGTAAIVFGAILSALSASQIVILLYRYFSG